MKFIISFITLPVLFFQSANAEIYSSSAYCFAFKNNGVQILVKNKFGGVITDNKTCIKYGTMCLGGAHNGEVVFYSSPHSLKGPYDVCTPRK